jgi:imidazoleglycerol-phosphate dehydratase
VREGTLRRETRETLIDLRVSLATPRGSFAAPTGQRFFDHMLEAFALHAGIGVEGEACSLDGIVHHVIEDLAMVLGGAITAALGTRAGIERFGTAFVAMDDALARAVVDCGGRAYARVALPLLRDSVEGLDTQLVPHFFRTFAQATGTTLHLDLLAGDDAHHCIEAAFKAYGRACRAAWAERALDAATPFSTKGLLG